jgi:uncharacterized protein YjbI with pentapeptide repeats
MSVQFPVVHVNPYPQLAELELFLRPVTDDPLEVLIEVSLRLGHAWFPLLGGKACFGLTGGQISLTSQPNELQRFEASIPADPLLGAVEVSEGDPPVWRFQRTGTVVVENSLTLVLGQWVPEGAHNLSASLIVQPQDLQLAAAEGLWNHDIHPNVHAVAERLLSRTVATVVGPQLCSSQVAVNHTLRSGSLSAPDWQSCLPVLEAHLARLLLSTHHDLPSLAERVGFNLQQDFVGGSLVGLEVSETDLSGVDWQRVNLRGAVLNDCDLTEANLSAAELAGADFSGALLSNANLKESNARRASFALANLSGADLRGADLRGATLTRTNFSGAQVQGLRLGENPGLSPEDRFELQQRGALEQP